MKKFLAAACVMFLSTTAFSFFVDVEDERDGETYTVTQVGKQMWLTSNLHFKSPGAKCIEEKDGVCLGYVYSWSEAMGLSEDFNSKKAGKAIKSKHQGLCPAGWHIPTKAEFQTLIKAAGGEKVAGKKLKLESDWNEYTTADKCDKMCETELEDCCSVVNHHNSGNGTNDYLFNASADGYFFDNTLMKGFSANFWSSTEKKGDEAFYLTISNRNELDVYDKTPIIRVIEGSKLDYFLPVRCVKD